MRTKSASRAMPGTGRPAVGGRSAATFDEGFVARVYRTSVLVYAIVSLYVWGYFGAAGWLGLTAGTALSLLSLAGVEWSARRVLARGGPPRRVVRWLWGVAAGKYAVFALLVAGVVWAAETGALNLFAFLGGFVL